MLFFKHYFIPQRWYRYFLSFLLKKSMVRYRYSFTWYLHMFAYLFRSIMVMKSDTNKFLKLSDR
jgi:hypothetical protein